MCISTWEMYGKQPKCDLCMPELIPENETVLDVYLKVCNQHIMGFNGPVDLNFQSLDFVLKTLGVKNKKEVFEKVHKLYKRVLKNQYDEIERKRKLGIK